MKRQMATARRQLDQRFKKFKLVSNTPMPQGGWIKSIRRSLGIRFGDLANKMDVTEGSIRALEKSERHKKITLDSLTRVADALNCDLVYSLVPRTSLEDFYKEQVLLRAQEDVFRNVITMDMENQSISKNARKKQLQDIFFDYLKNPPPDLWKV